jgi:hypothetical protein
MNEWLDMIDHQLTKNDIWIHPDYQSKLHAMDKQINKIITRTGSLHLRNNSVSNYYNYYPIKQYGNHYYVYVDINIKSKTFNTLYQLKILNRCGTKTIFEPVKDDMIINKLQVDFGG